ncbi:conserved hypothetical protein, partial [Trichinella spiralis]|uniref:hypothetical protein n=1 Tax=Trichinella spiralis TaxID=6334 RepID=UPI0001EFDC6F
NCPVGRSVGQSIGWLVGWLLYTCGDICTWSERLLAWAIGPLVDSGDCSRFKLVWVNASGRPKNSRLKRRKTEKDLCACSNNDVSISGFYYYWQRLGCSAQKVVRFSGAVDLMNKQILMNRWSCNGEQQWTNDDARNRFRSSRGR